jgi:hypothetical protein
MSTSAFPYPSPSSLICRYSRSKLDFDETNTKVHRKLSTSFKTEKLREKLDFERFFSHVL